jgi:hypothetical protein
MPGQYLNQAITISFYILSNSYTLPFDALQSALTESVIKNSGSLKKYDRPLS